MSHYEFDKDFNLREATHSVGGILWTAFKWVAAIVSLAVFYYIIFSLIVNTDEERRLRRENRMYESLYPEMKAKEALISDVVKDLERRDNAIYERLFRAKAPSVDPLGAAMVSFSADSVPDRDIVEYVRMRTGSLSAAADSVNANFRSFFRSASPEGSALPPLSAPVADLKFAQIGASVGQKINPFYKVLSEHTGLDFIVGQGTPVLAAADGVVSDIRRSGRGHGNVVEILHDGGYVTVYAHLEDIAVRKGERVKAGRRIANVGISGNSFAPHLHYEIYKDGRLENPVNYLLASFSPEEFIKVAYMAAVTGQSMD